MLLDRIAMEYGASKAWIAHEMGSLGGLQSITPAPSGSRHALGKQMLDTIDFQLDLLRKYMGHITSWFSGHLATRNMLSMRRLTFIATLAAVLGVIANLDKIEKLLEWLSSHWAH